MKKILSYILITLILSANLLAPISVGFDKNKVEINKNVVNAANETVIIGTNSTTDTSVAINGIFRSSDNTLGSVSVDYYVGNTNPLTDAQSASINHSSDPMSDVTAIAPDNSTLYLYPFGLSINNSQLTSGVVTLVKGSTYYVQVIIKKAQTDSTYIVKSDVASFVAGTMATEGSAFTSIAAQLAYNTAVAAGKTPEQAQQIAALKDTSVTPQTNNSATTMPACIFGSPLSGTFSGCIAQAFYYVFFVPTSYLFALSGLFFDSTFAYSVQDSSYKSAFVVQGWGLIRDFCNMLFIFIMLYVAIGTILSLHSMKTKETIVNVVIIGLFINFSLFATQIIIDASNITARVFYNSNAIKLTEKGVDGASTAFTSVGGGGVIPLSSALVNKINPQNMILNAGKITDISDTGRKSSTDQSEQSTKTPSFNSGTAGLSAGTFILIVIMASAVNIVGFTVFLTIGILFIARVIGLWLAMILSPLAFFTYILPEMAGTKMIGWKNWWPDTLKMAFLAPVFIFFLYIILKFLETDLISDPNSKTGLAFFVATIIPFVFIMLLMVKAKKIATDMSGEFGEMVTKAGSAVSGMVLGGAVGAGAFAMRGTLGAMGDKVANSEWAKTHGRLGNMVADAGKWTSSRSFDARKTALGTMAGKGMGVDMEAKGIGMGVKEGGYAKHKTEITEKRRARAESHKLGNMSEPVQTLHKTEERLSNLKNERVNDINRVDGTLAAKRLVASDASQKLTAGNNKLSRAEKETTAKLAEIDANTTMSIDEKAAAKSVIEKDLKDVQNEVQAAQKYFDENAKIISEHTQERTDLNGSTGKYSHKTGNGKVNKKGYDDYKKNVVDKSDSVLAKANADYQIDIAAATTDEAKAKVQATLDKAQKDYDETKKVFKEMQDATEGGTKNFEEDEKKVESLDNLSLKMIPELHHHVEKINADRVNEYATAIRGRFFNKEANDVAAHEAIMRSEVKKH